MKILSRIVTLTTSMAAVLGHTRADIFRGPGLLECAAGDCYFSVDGKSQQSRIRLDVPIIYGNAYIIISYCIRSLLHTANLGCSDPCHTRTSDHMYDVAIDDVAVVTLGTSNDFSDTSCYHRHATDIDSIFPDQYVTIEEGCTARCSGCTFSPTELFTGPTQINCIAGRCHMYTEDPTFGCGDDIELASDAYGELNTLLGGSNTVSTLVGYEGINNIAPITLPATCQLECSGCDHHTRGLRNMKGGNLFSFLNGV